MSEIPSFNSPDDVLSWLKQLEQSGDSSKTKVAPSVATPSAGATSQRKKYGRRKKIHDGELLSAAKEMLSLIGSSYRKMELDDFFSPITLDSHRRRLGPNAIEEQILNTAERARSDVLRFLLDIIDYFTGGIAIPGVKPSVTFWTSKAISAFIDDHPNTMPESVPWKELPRNIIAAEIIKAIEDAWFTRGFRMHEYSRIEAARIFESDNSVYAGFQKSAWGF